MERLAWKREARSRNPKRAEKKVDRDLFTTSSSAT
jgi:hypothetical protein